MSIIKKALLLGAGYVIGAHAGRERYDKLKEQATKLLQRPEVKQAGSRAQEAVGQKFPGVAQKLPGGGAKGDSQGSSQGDSQGSSQGDNQGDSQDDAGRAQSQGL